jgi:predicted amidohydrolase
MIGPMETRWRVASLQWQHREWSSAESFWQELAWQLRIAREDYAAQLVVLPEYVGAGMPGAWPSEEEWSRRLAECASLHGLWIVGGSFPLATSQGLLNRCLVVGPEGQTFSQDKLHITPWEADAWQMVGGNECVVIDTGLCKIGVAICYDVEFPEQIRALADAGAEVLCVPYCTDDANGHHRVTRCALARAVENTMYVVTAGGVGSIRHREGFAHHFAESVIATPCDVGFPADGILARALPGQAQCLIADLDLALLRKKRTAGTVLPLRDLRRDLFPASRAVK